MDSAALDPARSDPKPGGQAPAPSRWAWRLGQLFGIGIYVHATFWLLLTWIGLSYLGAGAGWVASLTGVALVLCVFGIVVLHELGHALAARRFGIRTRDITLYPIGGVASLERVPEQPAEELIVALAGPAVNAVLGAVLYAALLLKGDPIDASALPLVGGPFLVKLFFVNITIGIFNLIPAFPMDGGRVLRSLLALRMDYAHATEVAARVGQALALLFGLLGLFANPMLLLIALFVWMGAEQESSLARLKSALVGIPVRSAMLTDFRTLAPDDALGRAVDMVIAGSQHDFPVIDAGRPVGLLTRTELAKGLAKDGAASPVAPWMTRNLRVVDPFEMVDAVVNRLREDESAVLVVDKHDKLVGMLTSENIGELVMLRGALRGDRHGWPRVPRTV
jgi:Zn-dependent protease/CBS domain-containing protein